MALEVLPSGSVSWIALLLVVLAALGLLVTFWRRERSEGASWWVGALLVLVPLTVLMRAHHGGFMNVLMPGIWVLSIVGVLAVHTLGRQHPVLAVLGVVLACGPLVQGRWDPARYAPTEGDVVAMDTLLEAVQGIEGEVLVPHAPWLPVQAGKSPSFPLISLWDVDHYRSPFREEVRTLDKAFADQRWAAIMIANKVLAHGMKKHYRKVRKIKLQAKDGVPKTGWKVRPQWIWEPISRPGADQPADAADPEVLPDGSEGPGADEG